MFKVLSDGEIIEKHDMIFNNDIWEIVPENLINTPHNIITHNPIKRYISPIDIKQTKKLENKKIAVSAAWIKPSKDNIYSIKSYIHIFNANSQEEAIGMYIKNTMGLEELKEHQLVHCPVTKEVL